MASTRKTRIKVGVIGLGIIGSRVAAGLRGAGHQVYVWSRTPHSAPNFLGSVVEVADLCDVIQVFVSNDEALLEVVRTIAAALAPRHVLAAHATVSPQAAREAATIVESMGARYLDAPFTGSKVAAQNRQLVYYVGGSKEALEEARPVLEVTSKQIVPLGKVGDASVLKVATNMLTAATVQTLSEALAVVRSAGIDGQRLVEAFEHNASQSPAAALKLPAMIARNFEANFSLKHMLKDVRLAQGIGDEREIVLPVMAAIETVFSAGVEAGWGDEDFCVMTRVYDDLLPDESAKILVEQPATMEPASQQADAELIATMASTTKAETDQIQDAKAQPPVSTETEVVPKVEAISSPKTGLAPIGGEPENSQPRRRTLRIIRNLFKPA